MDIQQFPSPCYIIDEKALRSNLELIRSVQDRAGVQIILAFKAFALWRAFPIVREYIGCSTASSAYEAQLAFEEMGAPAHTYAPAYTDTDFDTIIRYSSHITFNSLTQAARFCPKVKASGKKISCGLRINPEYSAVETALYNPCAPGTRLGVIADQLSEGLPEGIEGLHFHSLCESDSYELEKTLLRIERKFGTLLDRVKWINCGGGHLITRKGYDTEHLVKVLKDFRARHPHLHVILEPGSAFAWQTGVLAASVVDIVENKGIETAILDVSFTCHMPDCLEMPYKPDVRGASDPIPGKPTYRLGGNSCLSGDYMGDWSFEKPLKIGDRILFEDMIHYTIVKTTMFNGIQHPALGIWHTDETAEIWRRFGYEDYKHRMG